MSILLGIQTRKNFMSYTTHDDYLPSLSLIQNQIKTFLHLFGQSLVDKGILFFLYFNLVGSA